ncbi:MAG: DUF3857 domain-containing protein [Cytophagales bacterium]|nr:DUF3857 domain-containing protein [Cytophagales bacterium]
MINIPEELKANADAVIREKQITLEVLPNFKIRRKEHLAVTIFNDRAEDLSSWSEVYDKYSRVDFVKCRIYNAMGKQVKTVKQKDIQDYSYIPNSTVFSDNRVKFLKADYGIYPYTIELDYQTTDNGFLDLPEWYLLDRRRLAAQRTSLELLNKGGLEIEYKLINLSKEPEKKAIEGGESWKWNFESVPAIDEFEDFFPIHEQLGIIKFFTKEFSYCGFKGSKESWKDFARWKHDLQEGRKGIPEELKTEIRKLTEGKSQLEKTRTVYEWMQKNSRYVNISLGIGGFQAMKAGDVYVKGYGDCKALTNFTQALLKEVGVKSIYSNVYGGRRQIFDTENVSQQFNHIILCVPNQGDTVWLECTDQTNPFGYLGNFTGDRYALLCERDNGRLVRTTSYSASDNLQRQYTEVELREDGNASVTIRKRSTGIQFEQGDAMSRKSYEDQKKRLYKVLDVPNPTIESYEVKIDKSRIPVAEEVIKMEAKKVVSKSGSRLFIRPNIANRYGKVSTSKKERQYDFILSFAFHDQDSIVWEIPKGYAVESLPKDKVVSSKFGTYSTKVKVEDGRIIYLRDHLSRKGHFAPELFGAFTKFQQQIYKNDKKRIVLKKNKT